MHRIDGPGATIDNKFTDGDPVGGVEATVVTDDFLNDVQEELISVLSAAAVTPVKGVQDQVLQSIYKLAQNQKSVAFTTAGTAAALTLTPTPAITTYASPLRFRVKFSQPSNGSGTLNVSGVGPKSLKQYDSSGTKVPAVYVIGQLSDVEYDGADFVVMNQLPVSAGLLDTLRIDVASATVVDLSLIAPNTRQINITGSASITSFGVTAGKCYFVRFAGNITLINGAQLITQTGRAINANSGDTCIIRSTAANAVEVLCFSPGGGWDKSFSGDGYSRGGNGMITQWGRSTAVIPANGGTIDITFPITFPGDIGFAGVTPITFGVNNQCTSLTAVAINTSTVRITNWDVDSTVTQIRWLALGY